MTRTSTCCGADINYDRAPYCTRCGEPQPHPDPVMERLAPSMRRAHNLTVRPFQGVTGTMECNCAGCRNDPVFKVRLGFREDDWTAYLCAGHLADLVGEARSALGEP